MTGMKAANCQYCGNLHEGTVCPLIKAIEYHPNGQVKRIEFKNATDSPQGQWIAPPIGQTLFTF